MQRVGGAGKTAAETLKKVMENIVKEPGEAKFRTLKLSNKAIQEKIGGAEGGMKFLTTLGFVRDDSDAVNGPVIKLGDDGVQAAIPLMVEAIKDIDQAMAAGYFN